MMVVKVRNTVILKLLLKSELKNLLLDSINFNEHLLLQNKFVNFHSYSCSKRGQFSIFIKLLYNDWNLTSPTLPSLTTFISLCTNPLLDALIWEGHLWNIGAEQVTSNTYLFYSNSIFLQQDKNFTSYRV